MSTPLSDRQNLPVRSVSRGGAGDGLSSAGRKRGHEDGEETPASRRRTREPSASQVEDQENLYDPNQSIEERRDIAKNYRAMQRDMQENPDAYLKEENKLMEYYRKADESFDKVKQPTIAAIESRGLLMAAELSLRKVTRMTSGALSGGMDVDEFVAKCGTFMLLGRGVADDDVGQLSSTQRHRRQATRRGRANSEDDREGENDGDMYNWEHLGRYACVPSIRRPAVKGFCIGPLSIEKKVRKITKRSQPLKLNRLAEVRPEALKPEDLARSEKNDLTAICKKIQNQLISATHRAKAQIESIHGAAKTMTGEEMLLLCQRHGIRPNGSLDLMKFVINPKSFGQTVENMFYVSFLIKEGNLELQFDEYGLPTIESVRKSSDKEPGEQDQRQRSTLRHQAVMSIDMATWRDLINAFDITEPMIEHREEETQEAPGAQGWYT